MLTSNKERPIIVITYHLEDGTDETISANNTTVWWKDKSYVIKEKDIFVNIVKGLFLKNMRGEDPERQKKNAAFIHFRYDCGNNYI